MTRRSSSSSTPAPLALTRRGGDGRDHIGESRETIPHASAAVCRFLLSGGRTGGGVSICTRAAGMLTSAVLSLSKDVARAGNTPLASASAGVASRLWRPYPLRLPPLTQRAARVPVTCAGGTSYPWRMSHRWAPQIARRLCQAGQRCTAISSEKAVALHEAREDRVTWPRTARRRVDDPTNQGAPGKPVEARHLNSHAARACRAGGARAERPTAVAPAGIKASSRHAPQRLSPRV